MLEQIERELVVDAPPEEVWDVVTSSGWLAAEVQFDLVPGGDASFTCEEWSKRGWVEEADAPTRLTFWWAGDGEPATRVELTLDPEGEGHTRLRLVEARVLDMLDVVGIPLAGRSTSSHGPAMLVAA